MTKLEIKQLHLHLPVHMYVYSSMCLNLLQLSFMYIVVIHPYNSLRSHHRFGELLFFHHLLVNLTPIEFFKQLVICILTLVHNQDLIVFKPIY